MEPARFHQNMLMRMLAADLEARGVKDPLRQYYRFVDIWQGLCHLTQEPLPTDIAEIIKEPPFAGLEEPKP